MSDRLDTNLVLITGHLATEVEHKAYDSGAEMWHFMVVVRVTYPRRRVDVIPVTYWSEPGHPPSWHADHPERGHPIWVLGSIQRRFWSAIDGRHNRMEVIAEVIRFAEPVPFGSLPAPTEEE